MTGAILNDESFTKLKLDKATHIVYKRSKLAFAHFRTLLVNEVFSFKWLFSRKVFRIMSETKFGPKATSVGITQLVSDGGYSDAFPLHEVRILFYYVKTNLFWIRLHDLCNSMNILKKAASCFRHWKNLVHFRQDFCKMHSLFSVAPLIYTHILQQAYE